MTLKLVVVADLGRMRAYKFEESEHFSQPRLELIEDATTPVTQKLSETLTDYPGQHKTQGNAIGQPMAASGGEAHNLELERRKRALKTIAARVGELLKEDNYAGCYLAADSRIQQPLLDAMDPQTRSQIQKCVSANLSKLSAEQVLKHFAE